MAPEQATAFSLERIRRGENTISVTGNVLRDYLTDLFPILELGTSAKMLSVVPLIERRRAVRDGRRGLGPQARAAAAGRELPALGQPGRVPGPRRQLRAVAERTGNRRAQILADTLDRATGTVLDEDRSPTRKLGGIDNRGSHFYLALYWAEELAAQDRGRRAGRGLRPPGRDAGGQGGG